MPKPRNVNTAKMVSVTARYSRIKSRSQVYAPTIAPLIKATSAIAAATRTPSTISAISPIRRTAGRKRASNASPLVLIAWPSRSSLRRNRQSLSDRYVRGSGAPHPVNNFRLRCDYLNDGVRKLGWRHRFRFVRLSVKVKGAPCGSRTHDAEGFHGLVKPPVKRGRNWLGRNLFRWQEMDHAGGPAWKRVWLQRVLAAVMITRFFGERGLREIRILPLAKSAKHWAFGSHERQASSGERPGRRGSTGR